MAGKRRLTFPPVEKMASRVMAAWRLDRNTALARLGLFWLFFGIACALVVTLVPLEGVMIGRKRGEAPAQFVLTGLSAVSVATALICWLSQDRAPNRRKR